MINFQFPISNFEQQRKTSFAYKFQNSKISNLCHWSLVIIWLLVIGYWSFNKPVLAQTSRSFTLSPPSLQLTLKPGQKAEKTIKITNNSIEPLEFSGNVVDFIVTDKAGTPELLPSGTEIESRYAASSWSMISPESVVIQPGKVGYITFYVQVPGDARPGGRYFAIALKPNTGSNGENNTGASVNSVVGSLVYLTVAGKTNENARITAFSAPQFSEYGPIALSTEIKNLGDLHVNPKATIEIKNIFGKKVFSTALANLNIFPGTSRIYKNSWETKWLFGPYKASLSGYFGLSNNLPLTAMATFWVIPYKLIVIVLLAIAIGIGTYLYSRKKQEKEEEEK